MLLRAGIHAHSSRGSLAGSAAGSAAAGAPAPGGPDPYRAHGVLKVALPGHDVSATVGRNMDYVDRCVGGCALALSAELY